MTKIAIFGIGGVGGYLGGLLAKRYKDSSEVEIYFIVRGENERQINLQGLKLQTTKGDFTVHPALATSDASLIGVVDLLICCIKGYDINKNIDQVRQCVGTNTVFLPLLNGLNGMDAIKNEFPDNTVWGGCIYLVSKLSKPGVIKETGGIDQLFFGSIGGEDKKLTAIESIFNEAGIKAEISSDIVSVMWEKFVFISAMATVTSYYDANIGLILSDPLKKDRLLKLFDEIVGVAKASHISLPNDIIQKAVGKLSVLPPESTSSMHLDFTKGKSTELESLTGYVVALADKSGVGTPVYDQMYTSLLSRSSHK
jgi:2-dehydropantoate 2-reductase